MDNYDEQALQKLANLHEESEIRPSDRFLLVVFPASTDGMRIPCRPWLHLPENIEDLAQLMNLAVGGRVFRIIDISTSKILNTADPFYQEVMDRWTFLKGQQS